MADYIIQGQTLTDIADAIRAKTGGDAAMTPAEMVTEIGNISALESVSGTFTPVSNTGSMPAITHNLGTYDVFVIVYVDSDNYALLQGGGYATGTHSPVKIVAVIGNLNKGSQVKTFGALRLSASNSIGAYTTSISTGATTINEVAFTTPNATYWRPGITYKYTVVKYGENTTEMGA